MEEQWELLKQHLGDMISQCEEADEDTGIYYEILTYMYELES